MKELLSLISKPVRYLGNEINSIRKDTKKARLRFCLAFPDVYEVGMSHLGIQILYHILNGKEGVVCERAFAPWIDMEKILRERNLSLSSLETSTPLAHFDLLGFSLQYELCFTNFLNMLDLSHIPFFSQDRDERFPLIIAGGPTAFNPEPVADFLDAIVIGDGEEAVLEICDLVLQWKEARGKKEDILESLSQLEGVYVPSIPPEGRKIRKRLVSDLNQAPFPTCPIVPYMKVVHDRLSIEIARGCKRGCRFCEAGFIHRPYRERAPQTIEKNIHASLKQTGYEEVSLLSLSAGDYSLIGSLLPHLMDRLEPRKVAVSFPSLRIESIVGLLAEEVKRVRKTGFTIAPEAGTERLRSVINKNLDEAVLFQGLSELFAKGWKNVKLYFMIGLPTEREEDLRGIIGLSRKLYSLGEKQRIRPNVNVSVSTFVPKPHTPFQWESQIPLNEMKEKLHFLREEVKRSRLQFKWQDPHLSFLEGIFSRGNRRLSRVLVEAHRLGCRFDGWTDQFHYSLWQEAFEKTRMEMESPSPQKGREESLPWSFIDTGVNPSFLWEEYQKALREEFSPSCAGKDCRRCGICDGNAVRLRESSRDEFIPIQRMEKGRVRKKPLKKKIRLRFKKEGDVRYISHLELAHLFYRAAKRAELPLCYSEGFHPLPRIVFATALPVGVESLSEIVDMDLEARITPREVMEKLNQTLPQGIKIIAAEEMLLFSSPSIAFRRSIYWMPLARLLSKEEASLRIQKALERTELLIDQERKGKTRTVDVRPLIEKMEVKENGEESNGNSGWGAELILRKVEGRGAKPTEIFGTILGIEGESLILSRIVKIE